jgi:5'-3' exonuclease
MVLLFVVTLTGNKMVDMAMHLRKCVDRGDETNRGKEEEMYIAVRTYSG